MWEELMRLYATDPEAFYKLAVEGPVFLQPGRQRDLAALAERIKLAVRFGYKIVPHTEYTDVLETPYDKIEVPELLSRRVGEFLLMIDGKTRGGRGADCQGRPVGPFEVRFKLRS